MRLVVLGVLEQDLVHVGWCILVEFIRAAEDDKGDLTVTQHRKLVRFLHDAEFALVERHLFSVGALFIGIIIDFLRCTKSLRKISCEI